MGAPTDRTRVFFDSGSRYVISAWIDEAAPPPDAGRRLARHEARWALGAILEVWRGPEIADACRALLRRARAAVDYADVHAMRAAILDAAERGDLLVYEAGLVGSSVFREVEDAAPARGSQSTVEDKTWIEIVLVDDDDPPQPVAFASYRVELPDGSTRTGMLDAGGKARLAGIDPGSCKISFPSFHETDWS
jgi:hypothetical protein